jgi:hypothetical protein
LSPRPARYDDFTRLETGEAEQAGRLRRSGGQEPRRVDQRTFAQRRVGAGLARPLATGDGLDELVQRSDNGRLSCPNHG